jgi:twitching motility protein PilT
MDVAYSLEGHGRFRASIFRQRGSIGVILRIIPITIRSFSELRLPRTLERIAGLRRGLVVVAGAAGHGKTTTLAAMVEHVNTTRRAHVVTVEDPIEFLFKHKRAVISQREIGTDTRSFAEATLAAMRQDPDVILIGELGDQPTLEVALKAAETGHLVLASLHTTDAVRSVNRLLQLLPADQEPAARARLADTLAAVIALRLVPINAAPGRVPVVEMLRSSPAVQNCILRPERTAELPQLMARDQEPAGMQTFDQHLAELVANGTVDVKVARAVAADPEALLSHQL